MPPRCNEFQALVYLVRTHLAQGATVTESAMLRDRVTGRKREVDVCVRGTVGSEPITLCLEARDLSRGPVDVGWVDAMKTKHDRLETHALILVSRSGFTLEASRVATSYGIKTIALEDVEQTDIPALLG